MWHGSSWFSPGCRSRIHHVSSKGALRMSWTQPLAYCGSYSCFDGVISAEVLLDHISQECKGGLGTLNSMARTGTYFNAQNASVFVVNHVSQHRDQTHGCTTQAVLVLKAGCLGRVNVAVGSAG
eukprot:Skav228213  [mRNA]  locus=scaffold43:88763:90206:+ [translate_table: standard]